MADKVCSICFRTNKSGARYCQYCGFPMDALERNPKERAAILKKAAEKGYADAQNRLGNCYLDGKGVSKDYGKAVYWYRKAADQGDKYALYNLGNRYYFEQGVPKDYTEAARLYRMSAEKGYADAQNKVGNCYYDGTGVPKDYDQAVYWYRKAAEQGNIYAQYNLGNCYYDGTGVSKDDSAAVYWYRQAADQDHVDAQNCLGNRYLEGTGILKDYTQAVYWYRRSAEQGNMYAQYNLGNRYYFGEGVSRDYNEAEKWFLKAAEQGYPDAIACVGDVYNFGRNNYTEAAKWYAKAADQGHVRAQYNLGVFYYDGTGVPQDYGQAVYWYRKAAEQGYANAQNNLGHCYYKGEGVEQNYKEAEKWFRLALENGNQKAQGNLEDMEINGLLSSHEDTSEDPSVNNQIKTASGKEENTETVEDLLEELNAMVGLDGVKREVQKRINRIRIAQKAGQLGSNRVFHTGTLHMVFTGNPGTGKTTVARLLGKIYGKLGVLKNPDVFVECGRNDLVGQYIGQTALKVKDKFEEAEGGILFIDEAYALYKPDSPSDFGHEAIDTMVQYMDTMREDVLVIVAGYRHEMETFIRDGNPGLASRFRTTINFEDYTPDELLEIFESMVKKDGMKLDPKAKDPLRKMIAKRSKRENFGNARGVRNLFEDVKEAHDTRLADMAAQGIMLDADTIDRITAEDILALSGNASDEKTDVDDLLSELDEMVGLHAVKKQLRRQVAIVQAQLNAQKAGVTTLKGVGPQHMIFAGNPGTGKTTVARLVGKIYEALGIIEDSSIFIECGRGDLIGKYIGQTAPLVQKKVQSALGGILFIDEAYSLYQEGSNNDFGSEAISELVRQMENNRDRLIVILAGYSDDMKKMINNANAGLKSRFPVWLDFEDYTVEEMVQIFQIMLEGKGYHLEEGSTSLPELIIRKSTVPDFGNGRGVRNLVDDVIAAQSMRLARTGFENIKNADVYTEIKDEDLREVMGQVPPIIRFN